MIDLNEVTIRGYVTHQSNQKIINHLVCYKPNTKEALTEDFSPEHLHTLLGALQRLQRRLNKVGKSMGEQSKWAEAMEMQETQRKRAEAMAQHVEKAQRQECGDIFSIERVMDRMKKRMEQGEVFAYSIPVNLPHHETQQLRTKALEFAIASYGESVKGATSTSIIDFANRFYAYITKGE